MEKTRRYEFVELGYESGLKRFKQMLYDDNSEVYVYKHLRVV